MASKTAGWNCQDVHKSKKNAHKKTICAHLLRWKHTDQINSLMRIKKMIMWLCDGMSRQLPPRTVLHACVHDREHIYFVLSACSMTHVIHYIIL